MYSYKLIVLGGRLGIDWARASGVFSVIFHHIVCQEDGCHARWVIYSPQTRCTVFYVQRALPLALGVADPDRLSTVSKSMAVCHCGSLKFAPL